MKLFPLSAVAVITFSFPIHLVEAQTERPQPRAALSTRATVEVTLNGRMVAGNWNTGSASISGPARIAIDYGQPHARGRTIVGGLVPWDKVWRTGANMATHLHTDVDITIGGAAVPRGIYTLFTLPSAAGWKLIISKQTLEWGEDHDPASDLARIDLTQRALTDPVESLTFWLIPAQIPDGSATLPNGVLKLAWEKTELTTNWSVSPVGR